MTPENRGRLVRAVVQAVEVDEPANEVKVVMADLGGGVGQPEEPGCGRRRHERTERGRREAASRAAGAGKGFVAAVPAVATERPARVAVMLAFAHLVQRAIDRGEIKDRAEVARRLGQALDLALLGPREQERLLALMGRGGREPVSERSLRDQASELVLDVGLRRCGTRGTSSRTRRGRLAGIGHPRG